MLCPASDVILYERVSFVSLAIDARIAADTLIEAEGSIVLIAARNLIINFQFIVRFLK